MKEFLGLEEVGEILKKFDSEKKGWDREGGRRSHEFFIPNGSKILVGSYVQLRRDGVDFNMVRDVFRVTGDVGIEVLHRGGRWEMRLLLCNTLGCLPE
jgi:hypothetical protein